MEPKGRFRLSDMELDFVSLVPAGDDPLAQVVIAKAAPDDKRVGEGQPDPTITPIDHGQETNVGTINKSDLDPEVVAYIDGLESEVDDLTASVEKAEGERDEAKSEVEELKGTLAKSAPVDETAQEEITKALLAKADPAVRALIEKQQADLKAASDIAKAEREARLSKEFLSKAEALPMLSADTGEEAGAASLAGLLRRAADALTPEDSAALEKMLKAANEQIAKGNLFGTIGRGGAETTISKSLKAMAAEFRKADPTLTQEMAEVKAMEENPELATALMNGEED